MTPEPRFLRRFEQIWSALRRHQARLGLSLTLLAAAAGLGLLAWADYRYELPRAARAAGLATASMVALAVLVRWVVAPLRWWTRPRTATEIEGRFPQLGQRIRTVVQFAGQPEDVIMSGGVAPSLVGALNEETEARSAPLPLDSVIPRWRVYAAGALAAVPIALLAVAAIASHEWRTALLRSVLIERPYTTIEVKPGDILVDQGVDVPVAIEIHGRPRPMVALETRPAGKADAPWKSQKLDAPAKGPASHRETKVEKVKDPLEYRAVAGPAGSGTYAIRVRYPLAIQAFDVTVTPPSYTGLEPSKLKGGDIQAVEGSNAAFRIVVDEPGVEASLVEIPPKSVEKGKPAPSPLVIPLKREGNAFVATLGLSRDLDYRVEAKSPDGRALPKNRYRIDVRGDRAPRVAFEEPDEALEVHPIAEVKHRIRVDDDFGLTRAGIVFRFNDGDEKTLILKDFPITPGQKPKTSAKLEETLLLETLAATAQDSVTYYGFAEDNFPDAHRRTETDLRYIDLRVFRREYKLAEPGSGDGDPMELTSLDELIARQRVNLNRANRLAKHKPGDRTAAEDPLKVAGFEEALVGLTRDFTAGIEALADARVDALHKALDAMQASVDALDRGRNDEAPPAMAEALKNLVAARRALIVLIGENSALAAAMRKFDRTQAQKIRKPKTKDEEAEEIANDLEQLAQEEEFVYATLAASAQAGEGQKGEKGEPKESQPKESKPKDPAKAAAKGEAAPKGEGDQGKDGEKPGDKGDEGAKGEGEKGTDGAKGQGAKGQGGQGKDGTEGSGDPKGDGEPKDGPGAGDPKGKGEPKGGAKEGEPKDGPGKGEDGEGGSGEPKKLDRRAIADKQEEIADTARDLEEKLKRLEMISDLAKARMAKAAEKAEQTSGALARGNLEEATQDAKAGAVMLRELARQVKGEVAREAADQLAMARDLAEELAREEADLAANNASSPAPGQDAKGEPGKGKGEEGKGEDGKGKGEEGKGKGPDGKGEGEGEPGKGRGPKPGAGPGRGGFGARVGLTEEEQIDRMAEAARTLEEWLKQIDKKAEGKAAEAVREILDQGNVAEIVERAGRMGEVRLGGKREELGREAKALSGKLELLAQALELLHRGIVAPELAAMVEFDRRLAELTARLGDLKSEAAVAAWRRDVAELIRDMEKAGIAGVDDLADALRVGGGWHWDSTHDHIVVEGNVLVSLQKVSVQIKDRVQELILKDLASARDEATPPMFRELVDRYYEVLSRGVKSK